MFMSSSPTGGGGGGGRNNFQQDLSEFTLSDSDIDNAADGDLPSELFSSPEPSAVFLKHGHNNKTSHDQQLMKIELSQKTLELQQLKFNFERQEEDHKDVVEDLQNQVNILQSKLQSDLLIQKNESQRRQGGLRRELEEAQARHRQLEEQNQQLLQQANNLKRMFQGELTLSLEEYETVRMRQRDGDMGIRDFVLCKLFEAMKPIQSDLSDAQRHILVVESERDRRCEEVEELRHELDKEHEIHEALRLDYQKLLNELSDVKSKVQSGNYKIENFDRVLNERNNFEADCQVFKEQLNSNQVELTNLNRDRDDLHNKWNDTKQKLVLVTQDKDYLTKQITELTQRCGLAEEKYENSYRQVEDLQRARETIYEKYVSARDQYKTQYENQLREEVEKLRMKTDHEIDRLKTGMKDLYERENLSLKEQRDAALEAHDKCAAHARDLETRLDRQRHELMTLQTTQENRLAELLSQCKVRSFEAERCGLLYEESKTQLQHALDEGDKLRAKIETITKEFYQMEAAQGKRISSLDYELNTCQQKLKVYENLEDELDKAVMQAAELSSPNVDPETFLLDDNNDNASANLHAERILSNFGAGKIAAMPSVAKRRMRQSVELARRVIQLERTCATLQRENNQLENRVKESGGELDRVNSILNEAQQPYSYLIDSLRSRDSTIRRLQNNCNEIQQKLLVCKKERSQMIKEKNAMAADLERLLGQREELTMLRQLVESMRGTAQPQGIALQKLSSTMEETDALRAAGQPIVQRNSKHVNNNKQVYGRSIT